MYETTFPEASISLINLIEYCELPQELVSLIFRFNSMELTMTTPAILFPTISLLLLAYTNRFVAIGNRIRALHMQYKEKKNKLILIQIKILRLRIRLIRDLQVVGIFSFFLCVLTVILIFEEFQVAAKYIFTSSLVLLMISFGLSAWEIIISTKALNIQLLDLEVNELERKGIIKIPNDLPGI